jgi:hypothetical protein
MQSRCAAQERGGDLLVNGRIEQRDLQRQYGEREEGQRRQRRDQGCPVRGQQRDHSQAQDGDDVCMDVPRVPMPMLSVWFVGSMGVDYVSARNRNGSGAVFGGPSVSKPCGIGSCRC